MKKFLCTLLLSGCSAACLGMEKYGKDEWKEFSTTHQASTPNHTFKPSTISKRNSLSDSKSDSNPSSNPVAQTPQLSWFASISAIASSAIQTAYTSISSTFGRTSTTNNDKNVSAATETSNK